jgi:hypothetical protein
LAAALLRKDDLSEFGDVSIANLSPARFARAARSNA